MDVFTFDRMVRWTHMAGVAIVAVGMVLLEGRAARAEPGVPVPPNQLITDSGAGAVSEADRDFAIKVRLAGLWEIPAGEMAQRKSDSARIRAIGRDIAAQHVVLDRMVRQAAKTLSIRLPNKPNADQQTWLAEMRDAEGAEFDQIYIDRLRAAHGKIFPAIATIRSSTRNDTVRKLAQRANQFVMTHLTLLESSGIVDFAALPTAPPPGAAAGPSAPALSAAGASRTTSGRTLPLVLAVLGVGLGATVVVTRRMRDPRRRRRGYRNRYYGY